MAGRPRGVLLLASTKPPPRPCSRPPAFPCRPAAAPSRRDEAVAAASALGFPVALKALGVAHKSEAGAVKLNLRDEASVRAAAEQLVGLGTGLYVERMVEGGVAELIVGVTRDPLFGPVMTVGSGGVLVELLKDSATLLLPASRGRRRGCAARPEAVPAARRFPRTAEGRSRCGDRCRPEDFRLSRSPMRMHSRELDVNPLIVCAEGKGAWVADALLVIKEA